MKKFLFTLAALAFTSLAGFAQGDISYEDLMKERQMMRKESKDAMKKRVAKATKKEAKRLAKEGWQVLPGSLPMERQLDRAYDLEYQINEDLSPAFFIGAGQSTGQNVDAAKLQANEMARMQIATKMETEMAALIENSVGNKQTSPDEAVSLSQMIANSKTRIHAKMGRTQTIFEAYRKKPNGNVEVLVRMAYSYKEAKKAAQAGLQEQLSNMTEEQQKRLKEIVGW
jgi:hypothetical protein